LKSLRNKADQLTGGLDGQTILTEEFLSAELDNHKPNLRLGLVVANGSAGVRPLLDGVRGNGGGSGTTGDAGPPIVRR